jgi:hypothetical protein
VKTFVWLFISSAIFGLAIGATYWWIAHEESTGTVLLGIMTAAFLFAAGYALVAERDAHLAGDGPETTPREVAGEDLGTFTTASAYPILIACTALLTLLGLLWSPPLCAAALLTLILILWRLAAESART